MIGWYRAGLSERWSLRTGIQEDEGVRSDAGPQRKKDGVRCRIRRSRHPNRCMPSFKSTQLGRAFEGEASERQDPALNGESGRRMERRQADTIVSWELLGGRLVGAHPVENPLHKDDSHVDVAGDAGDVEVADFGADGIGEKGSVVRNHVAVIVLSDEGLVEGVEDAARDAPFRPAMVMRILAGQGGDKEGAEELAGGVLQIAVAYV